MGLRFSWKMCFLSRWIYFCVYLVGFHVHFVHIFFSLLIIIGASAAHEESPRGYGVHCVQDLKTVSFYSKIVCLFCLLVANKYDARGNIFEMPTFRIAHYQHGSTNKKKKRVTKRKIIAFFRGCRLSGCCHCAMCRTLVHHDRTYKNISMPILVVNWDSLCLRFFNCNSRCLVANTSFL